MAWEHYKETATERKAIEAGYNLLHALLPNNSFDLDTHFKTERKGCGFHTDRIPPRAAMALLCKWFLDGVNEPNTLLRDVFKVRPAALFATGWGATLSESVTEPQRVILQQAVDAHEAAFRRHMDKSLGLIAS